MASEEEQPSRHCGLLEEVAQHFEFGSFYKQAEFCDRTIRLEILEECRTDCGNETAETLSQVPSSTPAASGNEGQPVQANTRSRSKRKENPGKEASQKKSRNASVLQDRWSEEIPVNSIVLAAKSPVLRTMLSNGMQESDKSKPVLLKATPEEKHAFKEMLHFLYAGSLSTAALDKHTSLRSFVDMLVVGDKFEVRSFMGAVLKALSERQSNVADSEELALRVPEVLEQHPEIKEVVTKARDLLRETFRDADSWYDAPGFLTLKQDAVRFLLQSDFLEAESEEEIYKGTVQWVLESGSTWSERQKVMGEFSRFIRFACMRGEYLVDSVLSESLMHLPKAQERVKRAIQFRAYSDDRKAATTDSSFRERQGIRETRLEILCNLAMQEDGSFVDSQAVKWHGSEYRLRLKQQKKTESDCPTVGIFLMCNSVADQDTTTKIKFCFYIRTWPDGFWETIFTPLTYDFSSKSASWGYPDALGMSWIEAKESKKFVGSTGEVSLKVIMRRK